MNIVIDIQCCRTCLESTTDNYLLDNSDLIQKLEITTSTVINDSDGLPLYFCSSCYAKLQIAYKFRQQTLKACKALKDYITKVQNQCNEIFKHRSELAVNDKLKEDINDQNSDDNEFEFESFETVTLQNQPKKNIDLPFNTNEKEEFSYAIEKIDEFSQSLQQECENEDQIITKRLNERIEAIVYESKTSPVESKSIEIAKVQYGAKKLVKCEKCEKVFRKDNLGRHMAAHTGESKFKCEICNKNFTQKTGLNRHMLIHTGERPYKCEQCGKHFSQSKSLKFHMAVHGDNNTFSCTICTYKFMKSENLKIHMKEKHSSATGNAVMHICQFCKKSFKLNYSLKMHIQKFHKDDVMLDIIFQNNKSDSE